MRINDPNLGAMGGLGSAGQAGNTGRAAEVERAGAASAANGLHRNTSDGDRISLSNLSRALQVGLEDTPERVAQVEQLREAVRSGVYQPDARAIARSLVSEALQLSGMQQRAEAAETGHGG